MKKQKLWYKFINPVLGNKGLVYHLGVNKDPNARPLKNVGSCESGAIYFTDLVNLGAFTDYGTSIAILTPIGRIKKDDNKWKASAINIHKIINRDDPLLLANKKLANFYTGPRKTVKEFMKAGMSMKDILRLPRCAFRHGYTDLLNDLNLFTATQRQVIFKLFHNLPDRNIVAALKCGWKPGTFIIARVIRVLVKKREFGLVDKLLKADNYKYLKALV